MTRLLSFSFLTCLWEHVHGLGGMFMALGGMFMALGVCSWPWGMFMTLGGMFMALGGMFMAGTDCWPQSLSINVGWVSFCIKY